MARKNPRKNKRKQALTLYQRAYLITGQRYEFLADERDLLGKPFADRKAVLAAWRLHGAEIRAECKGGGLPWAHFAAKNKAKSWVKACLDASKSCYLGDFEGHEWVCEYARPASEHDEWAAVKASKAFDSRWIRTWNDVEAVLKGCYFDENKAFYAVGFFRLLRHRDGEWAGRPFELLPWQKYDIIMPVFGWCRADGRRRFNKAYIEIPKKNGKSMLCSGVSLLLTVADHEPAAEVYNAAGEKEQAQIVFDAAEAMAKDSPYLDGLVKWTPSKKRGLCLRSASVYRALSAEHKNKDGYKTHGLVVDELHMQQDRKLWDVLVYGGRARRQPLIIAITTAGEYDPTSIGWEQHTYARRVLEGDGGIGRDTTFFAYIRCLTKDNMDRWEDPVLWHRVNPNLGITMDLERFTAEAVEAANMPTKRNSFQRYSLNVWTQTSEAAFKIEKWNAGAVHGSKEERIAFIEEQARGRACYGGLDLAAVNDACAAVLWFPPADYDPEAGEDDVDPDDIDNCHLMLSYFWLPALNIADLERQHNAPYSLWAAENWLNLTPGEVADYRKIRNDLVDLDAKWKPERWNYDKWSAAQLVTTLAEDDGLEMVEFGQGFGWMNAPTKEFERLMLQGRIRHAAHPMMDWMIGNCQFSYDAEERVKLIKVGRKNVKYKIDGPIAAVEALDGAIRCPPAGLSPALVIGGA